MAEAKSGTGSFGRHEPKDLLEGLAPGMPPQDSDSDGISDDWEKTHGLDSLKNDSARPMQSGYTAIEEYLNALAAGLIATTPKTQH